MRKIRKKPPEQAYQQQEVGPIRTGQTATQKSLQREANEATEATEDVIPRETSHRRRIQ